jgi:hypothetical protein
VALLGSWHGAPGRAGIPGRTTDSVNPAHSSAPLVRTTTPGNLSEYRT